MVQLYGGVFTSYADENNWYNSEHQKGLDLILNFQIAKHIPDESHSELGLRVSELASEAYMDIPESRINTSAILGFC